MKTFYSLFFLLIAVSGQGAGERVPAGGRQLAMGGTSVAETDLWSLGNNQAGAAWLRGGSAGLAFQDHFLLKELMYEQLGLAYPLKAGTFGIFCSRFGNNQYNELKAGFSFARKFGKTFSAGVQVDYLRIGITGGYGNKNLFSCEIGLQYHADRNLILGIHLLNPVPVKISRSPGELLPVTICAGLSYRFSGAVVVSAEAEKDLVHKILFRAGTEYHFAKPAWVRIGISTDPVSVSFGFGIEYGKLAIDMASAYHQALGFSPCGSLTYSF
ncbi:MAG: hypothetical protein WCK34_03250 [Bacteroidota bacterium]